MRSACVLATLAGVLGVVSAHRAHRHQALHEHLKKREEASPSDNGQYGCFTTVITRYGEPSLVQPDSSTTRVTESLTNTMTSTVTVYTVQEGGEASEAGEANDSPAPYTSFSEPGEYTVPASTVTLTSTVVVPCPTASSADTYPPGTYTRPETTLAVAETSLVYVCPFTSADAAITPEAPGSAPPNELATPIPAVGDETNPEPAPEAPAPEQPASSGEVYPAPESPAPESLAPEQQVPSGEAYPEPAPEQSASEQAVEQPASSGEVYSEPAPESPAPEQPAPEQPAPEQPAPEQPAPEQPVPSGEAYPEPAPEQSASEQAVEQPASSGEIYPEPAPESPAPEQPASSGEAYPEPGHETTAPEAPAPEESTVSDETPEAPASEEQSPEPMTSESAPPAPSTSSAGAPSSSPSDGNSGSSPISSNGNQWGLTYSPYTAEGGCKDADTVSSDISAIQGAGFTTVRLYSTDCSGLENVGNACQEYDLRLIVGIFIDEKGIDAARPQVDDLVDWGQWQMVELVVIGNEALFNKFCDPGSLASFILEVKETFQGEGYDGPVTTTETTNVWQEVGSALCDAIDVMGANIHPFFNSDVSPDQAGSFTAGQVDLISEVCPGKDVYNLESGWPHSGQANGVATPGKEEQRTALASIMDHVGANTVFFSFEDDMWKQPGEFGVEQSWGCTGNFGQ